MEIVTDEAGLSTRAGEAVCVLVDPDDDGMLAALVDVLPRTGLVHHAVDSRRPLVHVDDERIAMLAMVGDPSGTSGPTRRAFLVVDGDLLVIVGDRVTRDLVRENVAMADGPVHGLARALAAIAHEAESLLVRESDAETRHLQIGTTRLVSGTARQEARRRRSRLFEWRQLYATQSHLLDDDDVLAVALGPEAGRLLRPARSSFHHAAGVADRLYAVLGDLLTEQDTLSSQRLTLVTSVFLPLTVTTGFFGMNFGWLTDHVGSLAAFVGFGVLVPALSVLASLVLVRRYGV